MYFLRTSHWIQSRTDSVTTGKFRSEKVKILDKFLRYYNDLATQTQSKNSNNPD